MTPALTRVTHLIRPIINGWPNLDWNISDVHKLSFTYNGLDAKKDKPAHPSAIGRRGPDFTTLQFQNSGYEIVNKLNSFGAELKSNFQRWCWPIS